MTVYTFKNFNVYYVGNEYIIHNINKRFKFGHTHIHRLDTAKFLIKLSVHKSIPNNISIYLLESLIRINNDKLYLEKLDDLLCTKREKHKNHQYYFNSNKGCK
jgi:hypothetical protein